MILHCNLWPVQTINYLEHSTYNLNRRYIQHVCLYVRETFSHNYHVYRLIPGTKYYYVYGGGPYGYSKESYFIAPPIPSRTATTKILAYGGMMMLHYFDTSNLNSALFVVA